MKRPTLRQFLKWLIFPLYIIFVAFPNVVKHLIFLYFKRKIKVLRPNCVFLINPNSGLKLGSRLLTILKEHHKEDHLINLFDPNVIEFLKNHLNQIQKSEPLLVVICGGDGSMSSVINTFEQKLGNLDQCVFVPMPLGTGNDLSQMLNFGCKLGVDYLYEYFHKLNSVNSKVIRADTWAFTYSNEITGEKISRKMLLYFGFGYDGRIISKWDMVRRKYKFLFMIHVCLKENQ